MTSELHRHVPVAQLDRRRIVIVGAGPTGLGAASRLVEHGLTNVTLIERADIAGGLAGSERDPAGFTWDYGGHVQFSHYDHFDRLMDDLLGGEWLHHQREAWIWMRDRFIPYPFQNNVRHLPPVELLSCLAGFLAARRKPAAVPANFEEWIRASFGAGVARAFMLPYNFKVWAWPARELSAHWVGDRVAAVDLRRVLANFVRRRDDVGWGPNSTFRFPVAGGTGEIWRRLAARFPAGTIRYGAEVARIDTSGRRLHLVGGGSEDYDILISTMPIDDFVARSDLDELLPAAARLRRSTVHVVGVGLAGPMPATLRRKCWMYFPEPEVPFYRATVFSNYAPANVPEPGRQWSLMAEVSESPAKPVDRPGLADAVVAGMRRSRLIGPDNAIVSLWQKTLPHGYPTPSLERDAALAVLHCALERRHIYSRGRFGAWRYEVSNQDHSLMQGVEVVDRLLTGAAEPTLGDHHAVNRPRGTTVR
ncbi:MAG: NAD(P)/FAD-dependent oxidoreductase [Alphaproteobacteria bacterium]